MGENQQQQYQQALEYVRQMRAAGHADEAIISQFVSSGWTIEAARAIFYQPAAVDASTMPQADNYATTAVAKKPLSKTKLAGLILAAAVLLVIVPLMIFFLSKGDKDSPTTSNNTSENSEEFSTFTDPNFKISLPNSWSGDAGYEPGQGLVLFYSGEGASSPQDAANMVIYVTDDKPDYDRIEQQLNSMNEAKASYEIVKDEETSFGGHKGRYIEITVKSAEQPDKKVHVASISVRGEEKQYYIDIQTLDDSWKRHEKNIETILKSFEPLK